MPAYLSKAEYSAQTWISDSWLVDAEARKAGVIDMVLAMESARIDSNLVKRYAIPFGSPAPFVVQRWLIQLVNVQIMLVIGVDQTDMMYQVIQGQYDTALKELDLAANGEAGHFELPLKATDAKGGVVKGTPRSYTEHSPYVGWDDQGCRGRAEDRRRKGTFR